MFGGCVSHPPGLESLSGLRDFNHGPTTAIIKFRTVIQESFSDNFPSGDPSVDQGDKLNNDVSVQGRLLSVADEHRTHGRNGS